MRRQQRRKDAVCLGAHACPRTRATGVCACVTIISIGRGGRRHQDRQKVPRPLLPPGHHRLPLSSRLSLSRLSLSCLFLRACLFSRLSLLACHLSPLFSPLLPVEVSAWAAVPPVAVSCRSTCTTDRGRRYMCLSAAPLLSQHMYVRMALFSRPLSLLAYPLMYLSSLPVSHVSSRRSCLF